MEVDLRVSVVQDPPPNPDPSTCQYSRGYTPGFGGLSSDTTMFSIYHVWLTDRMSSISWEQSVGRRWIHVNFPTFWHNWIQVELAHYIPWFFYIGRTFPGELIVKPQNHTECTCTSAITLVRTGPHDGCHFVYVDYTMQNPETGIILQTGIPKEILTNHGTPFMWCTLWDALRIAGKLKRSERACTTCIHDLCKMTNRWRVLLSSFTGLVPSIVFRRVCSPTQRHWPHWAPLKAKAALGEGPSADELHFCLF